jgi:predicted nucleic acid-binding protein
VRLVLDTNVFVAAAYQPDSSSRRLLDAVAEGRATLLVSPPVFGEYRKVLPRAIRSPDAERRVRDWIAKAEPVEAGRGARVVPGDADDDKFVSLALAGKADAIVSSDAHLLALAGRLDVPVLRPSAAAELVG